jgi:hypothetical protein
VYLSDLHRHSDSLASSLREQPGPYLALVHFAVSILTLFKFEAAAKVCASEFRNIPEEDTQDIQVILMSDDRSLSIRDVQVLIDFHFFNFGLTNFS